MISSENGNLLLVNFEGYGILNSGQRNTVLGFTHDGSDDDFEVPLESKIMNLKKESCLILALICMTSSVVMLLYE